MGDARSILKCVITLPSNGAFDCSTLLMASMLKDFDDCVLPPPLIESHYCKLDKRVTDSNESLQVSLLGMATQRTLRLILYLLSSFLSR